MRSSTFFCPSGWSHDLEPGVGKLETEYPFFGGGRGWKLPELSERRELEKAKRHLFSALPLANRAGPLESDS